MPSFSAEHKICCRPEKERTVVVNLSQSIGSARYSNVSLPLLHLHSHPCTHTRKIACWPCTSWFIFSFSPRQGVCFHKNNYLIKNGKANSSPIRTQSSFSNQKNTHWTLVLNIIEINEIVSIICQHLCTCLTSSEHHLGVRVCVNETILWTRNCIENVFN